MTGEVNGSEETTFAWDPFDHLAKAETPGGTVTYAFDGLERLSERKSGEATQVFHYGDFGDMPTYETDAEGKTTTSYVQGARGLVEQRSGEATSFPLLDGHGDVTAIASGAGEVESRQSFDPWGNQLSGPSLEMGYLGAWERPDDPTSGLIQMGARSYAPSLASFTSEDPVLGHFGIGVSSNRYPYVWDNPVTRYDLDGRDVLPGMPICILGCSPSEPHEIAERAEDFVKAAGNTISHIHIHIGGGERECEKRFIASTSQFFPCEEEGSLEFEENEPGVPTFPIDPQHPIPVEPRVPVMPLEPEPVIP